VNAVPDSLFAFEFPPGTLVTDSRTQKAYYMPEGVDLLDEAIANSVPFVDGQVLTEPGRVAAPSKSNHVWLVVLNIAAIAALVAAAWYRRKRKLRQRT